MHTCSAGLCVFSLLRWSTYQYLVLKILQMCIFIPFCQGMFPFETTVHLIRDSSIFSPLCLSVSFAHMVLSSGWIGSQLVLKCSSGMCLSDLESVGCHGDKEAVIWCDCDGAGMKENSFSLPYSLSHFLLLCLVSVARWWIFLGNRF